MATIEISAQDDRPYLSVEEILYDAGEEGVGLSFAGCGDSGGLERIYFAKNGADLVKRLDEGIKEALIDSCFTLINANPESRGFEINHGGEVVFTLKKGREADCSMAMEVYLDTIDEVPVCCSPESLDKAKLILADGISRVSGIENYSGEVTFTVFGIDGEKYIEAVKSTPRMEMGIYLDDIALGIMDAVAEGYEDLDDGGGGTIQILLQEGKATSFNVRHYVNDLVRANPSNDQVNKKIAKLVASLNFENSQDIAYMEETISKIREYFSEPQFEYECEM